MHVHPLLDRELPIWLQQQLQLQPIEFQCYSYLEMFMLRDNQTQCAKNVTFAYIQKSLTLINYENGKIICNAYSCYIASYRM